MSKTPTVLLIMDGYGIAQPDSGNAVSCASTPVLDGLFKTCPHTLLSASGEDVGLPDGQIGNSEVGHTNIGAGRVVFQELPRISNSIKSGEFFKNPQYIRAMDAISPDGALHLMGLLSDGGVHSHITHLFALLDMAKQRGVSRVYVHAFLDGRDVPPKTGLDFVTKCAEKCRETGASIASVMGRFYVMDRDKRWDRLQKAYNTMVFGEGKWFPDPAASVRASYDAGITDEFMEPVICDKEGTIKKGDSVIFFNFRPDRAREITWALTEADFDGFSPRADLYPLQYVCTAQYDESLSLPIAFPPEKITCTFGEYMSALGKTQLRIAETEKYAHVTFFFNGGKEAPYKGEDRILVPSPKEFATYDLVPEMSANEVTEKVCSAITSGKYDTVVLNYANCDMVGHTGIMDAAVKAVETVDACVGRVLDAVLKMEGIMLITADHGNADRMTDSCGGPYTAHTTNPVPLILAGAPEGTVLSPGKLSDIVPTMLRLMELKQPSQMTGKSLIR